MKQVEQQIEQREEGLNERGRKGMKEDERERKGTGENVRELRIED